MKKSNARINEKKKAKEPENYTQALGELKCADVSVLIPPPKMTFLFSQGHRGAYI